jgi:hypothetical protein
MAKGGMHSSKKKGAPIGAPSIPQCALLFEAFAGVQIHDAGNAHVDEGQKENKIFEMHG